MPERCMPNLHTSIRNALIALALACSVAPAETWADQTPSVPVVTVTATGEMNVEPDEAVLTLKVEKFDRELAAAKQAHDNSTRDLLALIKRYAIPARDIQTRNLRMEVVHDSARTRDGDEDLRRTRPILGYLVSSDIVVKLTDLGRFEAFYSEVIRTGISEVSDVRLGDSKMQEHREAARQLAVKAARDKAESMAATLGQRIGKAVEIVEGASPLDILNANTNYYDGYSRRGNDTSTFASGSLRVTATVKASFLLD